MIKNQLFCIYVAIGQKRSTIAQLTKTLEEKDAIILFNYCCCYCF